MKKLLIVLMTYTSTSYGQMVMFTNQYGQPVGAAMQVGNTIQFTNSYGQPVGAAIVQPQPVQTLPVSPPAMPSPPPVPSFSPLGR
jgi:hypothetical protein